MANTPPLRPRDDSSAEADRSDVLRQAAPVRTAAFTAIVACAFLLVVMLVGLGQLDRSEPPFLSDALGPEESGAPLERTPAPGVGVRIHTEGYTVTRWGDSVSVVGEDVGGAKWRRHVHGVTRTTDFGAETIIVDGDRTEEFLTVTKRQGERTWRWKLATRLLPRLGRDGSVSFLDPTHRRVTGLVVDPVRILDEDGRDVTPDGLRWGLEDQGSSWWVTLELDDRDLPLPYVIDPAVTYRAAQTATTAGATSLAINVPAGVQANDLLVAHIARAGNAAINTPSGWTAAGGTTNGNFIRQATYYRVASGSEPASYTWTWTGSQPAAGGMSAYYGVKGSSPLDVVGTAATANNTTTVSAPSLTTTTDDALVLAFFASNSNSTYSTATGMTERHDVATTGMSLGTDDMSQATAGATGAKASTASVSGRVVGHQVSFNVDDVAPTVAQNDPGSPLTGTVALDGTANDQDSAVAQMQFQRSPAGAGTWTNVGSADTTSPYSVSFDTTAVTDGLYDVRAVAADVAGNTATSTAVANRRIDNTAPSSTTSFPAASTTYSAAGWNAGCGTSGFCGTHSDAGSGVQTVQVSIRQGTGNYWNGSGFSSASEVWNSAGLAGGNWSYAFAAATFPADGSYTVRVRATDTAGNVQTPASRTFTIDTTAPQTTMDSNPTDPTSSADADFTFSASEGGSSFQCRLDGGSWGACTSPQSYTGLSDGSHTFDVRATDAVGNQDASPASFTWLVDTTAPGSTTAFPAAAGDYNAAGWNAGCTASGLCGTHSDGAGSGVQDVEVSIRQGTGNYWNGSAFASASEVWNAATLAAGDWSYAFPASSFPANGDYTVRVRAVDDAGNTETAASRTFSVDTTAPQTTIDSSPSHPTSSASADFDFSANEGGATFECRVDGGSWGACTSPKSYAGLADGSHTFDVRAADPAGNTDATPASFTWLVDTTAPGSTTSFPAPAGEYNAAGWNAGCATSVLCGTYTDGSGSGVQTVEVSIRRGSGNYWDGSGFDSGTEVWNAAALSAGDWSYALDAVDFPADGSYTVRVRATDDVGNAETPSSRTFDLDTTDPAALFAFPAAAGEYSTAAWNAGCATTGFCGTYADATSGVAGVEISVQRVSGDLYWDGDSFDAASETFFAAALSGGDWSYAFPATAFSADGQYTVHVRATDDAGNTEGGPSRTFRIDDTEPSAAYGFPASGGTYNVAGWDAGCPAAGLCGTASDGGSGVAQVEISVKRVGADLYWDGDSFDAAGETFFAASFAAGSWSWDFGGADFPADGTYTAHVRASDGAGNVETGPVRTFTIDTAAPQTTIDAGPADPTTSASADFDFSGSEGSSTFQCRLDGGAWGACASPESYASLTDGSHTFDVRATDPAGNTDATPASFTWTVDTADPSSTVAFPAASGEYNAGGWNAGCATSGLCGTYADGAVGSGVQSVQVSIQRVSTGLYWSGASFSASGETLLNAALAAGDWTRAFPASNLPADGSYTVRVFATDAAGNAESPASRTFAYDDTAPTGSLTAPAEGAAVRGAAVAISSDSVDSGAGVASAEFQRRPAGGGAWTPVDTDTTAPYSVAWDTTALADGDYDLRVVTSDEAGNSLTSATRTVTVDNTAPSSATLDALAAAIRNGQQLTGSAADAGSGVDSLTYLFCEGTSCTPSTPIGSSTTGPTYGVTWSSQPADGEVRVLVRATDRAGNTLDSTAQTVLVDNTNPTGSLTAPADGADVAGTVAVSSDSADAGSGVASAEFQRRPAGGGAWTAIDVDANVPFSVDWDTTSLADGDYDVRVVTTDEAGNTFTSPVRTVSVDNAAPTVVITAPAGFVNGSSPDPFTVTATSPDGDVDEVELFRCSDASAGCADGTWVSLGVDSSAPYSASWPIDPDGNRALRAVATDGSDNTGEDVVDVTVDRTDPTGPLTAPADGAFVIGTLAVSSSSADSGSGVATADFQRRPAGGGAWTAIDTDATAPYSVSWDTTALADGDYDLRVVTTDEAGNTFTSPVRTVTVDNSAPSPPVVTLSEASPFAHVTGTEIFVNTTQTGTYDVDATTSDAHSGIDRVRFPGPTDDSSSPYGASYDFDDLAGGQTVTAFNGVGLTAASPFTVTPDTGGPAGGSVSYADGYDADGDVSVTVDAGTDALSGLAAGSAVLERRTAPLADGSCGPFAGGWSPVTSPDTVASGLCAQYRYRVSDRVGNETVYGSGDVVAVDLVAPSAPALTLDESSPFAHVAGTEIFLNTAESGSYDVEAAASDPLAGIDKVAFPGAIDDTGAPYVQSYDFDDLSGTQTVTAHDRAGNTAGSDFEVTEDVAAPSTTDDTASIGSAWQSAPVTVTLTPTDARSGVAATYYTTDGSVPTTASTEGTSIDLTADGVYTIRYFSVDNVGNVEPVRTAFDDIRIDRTNPAAPSITLSESSPFAYVSDDQIFLNTGQAGTYDVGAASSDAGSGLEKLSFPGGVDDTTSPYSASYAFGDLTGGQTVTAHDLAGNTASDTFTVTPDTAVPAGGFVSYPDGYDADGVVTVTFDAGSDALAGLDGASAVLERQTTPLAAGACDPFAGGWSAVTSPDTVPGNTCARYRYRVSDRVGNEAVYTLPANVVKVDLAAPQTTIDDAPADPSADASPSFQFSASEGGSTFQCRLDGGAWAPCTSPEPVGPLADGSHTFEVRATDTAGNPDPTPASHTWTVDTDAPETTLDSAPADPSTEDTPSFAFSADEAGSTFECRVDGGAWASCTSPEPVGPLADGPHTFDVRATDGAGNTDGTPAQHAWTVDTTASETTLDTTPSDPSNDPTPDFAFSADEAGSTFQCRVDGGSWAPCTSPATIGPLADGPHTFDVRATDPAGNTDGTPAQHAWDVNAGAPSVAIVQPSGYVNAADADPYTARATSPDGDLANVEIFRCSDASTDCATGSWVSLGTDATAPYEVSWPLDADGARALRAVATDTGSNTGEDVVTVTIDRSVPATSIDSAPSDPSASASAAFAFSADEGGVTYECRLDGGAWTACTPPESYAYLADGGHTFSVRATDAAGNLDATPASFAWTVDTAAPETTIDVAPSDPSPSAAPTFEFSSDEAGSTFECRLDGGAWGACTSPESLAGPADGDHTFRVRATDAAGNVDASPAVHTWTVDATPPGGGLADPGQFLRGTIALGASPTDAGAGVQSVDFQLSPADAGAWTSIDVDTSDPYGTSWDTTGEADGLYDLRVVVTDNAGNTTPSAVVEDRVVDNTAPGAALDDPGAYLRATVSLTSTTSDAGSGVASAAYQRSPAGAGAWTPVASSWDTTAVADGLYDLRVIVTDNAGNSTTSAPIADRGVDNTKPSLSSSGPADGSTIAAAGSLAVVAGEDVAGIANAEIDGAPAPVPTVTGDTVTYASAFANGPHTLSGELEDLAGNRQAIRVHFTVWAGPSADYPYVEKNSVAGTTIALRTASDTATLTVPSGAWSGAPAGDWLVVRLDPQPASGLSDGFQPASEAIDVTAYWALSGSSVTSFALPLELEIDNALDGVIPATYENGAWRGIEAVPGTGLPAAWNDGFERDGTNVRILTRHLTQFTLLQDVQAPTVPGGFKGTLAGKTFRLAWSASSDNSGLISAYRVHANSAVVKTVDGSALQATMGTFKPSDARSFQVAAVDEAGNVSAKSYVLRTVPKVTKLTLAAAKRALTKRGFKVGKVTYRRSSIPTGRAIAAGATGLRRVGTKITISVSKGRASARRPVTSTPVASPPGAPPSSSAPAPSVAPAPAAAPPAAAAPGADGQGEAESSGGGPFVLPFDRVRNASLSELRQELGFGLLVAAFSVGFAAVLRARRPLGQGVGGADQELLWDVRLLRSVGRLLRRLLGR
jgi:hypothetical protein